MARLLGREYTKNEFLMYSGNPSNFAGVTRIEYDEGKAKGVGALEVRTGSGLEFTLLADKCLDIYALRYKGITLSQQAKNGLTGPLYGQPSPGGFARSVTGGMLFTAGLLNAGPDSVEQDGTFHQNHGNIGVTPAENLCSAAFWEGDEYIIRVSGEMRESALFRQNLMLTRCIKTKLGSNELEIQDTLENLTGNAEDFCMLYHFNFGFPFLTEALKLKFPKNKCVPRTNEARRGLDLADIITPPEDDFEEHVFFRELEADKNGFCRIEVENPELGIGAFISYEQKNLPVLCQWKSMRSSDYALGIEPANMYIMGRREEKINKTIKRINGYEKIEFRLRLGAYDL